MIRACTVEDKSALKEIADQTFDETFRADNKKENIDEYLKNAFTNEKVLAELHNPDSFFYFIYYEDTLAGYLKLNINEAQTESFEGENLEIERIHIKTIPEKKIRQTVI